MSGISTKRYSGVAMVLHWLIAIGVIAQWRLAVAGENASSEQAGREIMANHFSLGIVILVLVLMRLAWRTVKPNPPLAAHLSMWERWLAKVTHTLFYVLLVVMPLAGWIAMSLYGNGIDVFGIVSLPALRVGSDPDAAQTIFRVHAAAGITLLILTAIHILGALKHTVIDRDGNLFRMLPFGKVRG